MPMMTEMLEFSEKGFTTATINGGYWGKDKQTWKEWKMRVL